MPPKSKAKTQPAKRGTAKAQTNRAQTKRNPAVKAKQAVNTQERKSTEEIFHLLSEQSLMGITIIQDSKVVFVNEAMTAINGRSVLEMLAWQEVPFRELIHPADFEFAVGQAMKKQSGDSDVVKHYAYRVLRPDGTERWVDQYSETIMYNSRPADMITMIDITERRKAEDALRVSDERYRLLFSNSMDAVLLTAPDGSILEANPTACEMFGCSEEELIRGGRISVVDVGDRRLETALSERARTGKFQGELTFVRKDGSKFPGEVSTQVFTDQSGQSRTSMVIRDITERMLAEEALRDSEELHRIILGSISDAVFITDNQGNFVYICPNVKVIFGYSPAEVSVLGNIEKLFGDALFDSREFDTRQEIQNIELQILTKTGVPRDLLVNVKHVSISNGTVLYTCRDITERKQAEDALRESQQHLSMFFNQSLDGFFFSMINEPIEWNDFSNKEKLLDYVISHQHITEANDAMIDQYGSSREKFMGRTAGDFFAHDLEQARRFRKNLFDAGRLHFETEERKDDGTPIWIEGDYVCIFDPQKRITGMFGIQRDVTSRKQAEEVLQEAEIKYRNLVERLSQVIYTSELGNNGMWSYVSPQIEKLLGFTPQEWMNNPGLWYQQVHPDDRDIQLTLEKQAFARNEPFESEYRILTRAGNWIWVRDSGYIFPSQGYGPPIVQGMLMDITERKQAEVAVSLSKAQLLANLENTPHVAVQWYDKDGRILYLNPASESLYGWKSAEVIGKTLDQLILTPEEQMEFLRILAEISKTGNAYGPYEAHIKNRAGEDHWVLATTFSQPMNDGQVGFVCIDVDITERKKVDDNLRKAEAKYRMLVEQIPPIIYLALPGQDIGVTYISPQIKTLGFTEEEWIADPELWLKQIHPDDQAKVMEHLERISQGGEPYKLEYRLSTRAGVVRWFIDEVKEIVDETGNILFRQGFMLDITERKRAEEALILSKAQLLANLEHTPNVAVQWYDKDGYILYWNPASESMYGWKSIETLGKTLEHLIHTPEEQAEFIRILADIQATGSPFGPYEARVRRKDGTSGWILATTFSMPMPDGQLGFVCMDVDINERKQAEELIQRQLRRLNALHTIDMAINSSANVQITLEVLLSQTLSQLNIDAADVLLFNQPAQTLELTANRGFRSNISLQSQQRLGEGFAGQVINARRTIHISNLMEAGKNLRQMYLLANDSFTEYFGVPLIAKGQIKGVLEIYHRSPLNPEDDWLNFLEVLAGQAAIAIDNAQLVQGLQRSNMEIVIAYDATIEGWSRAMDLRDKETEGHTQRVTTLTLKLARAMGIREADIIQIQRGGLLHDIGKLGVPDGILLKPDKLTDAEWEIMRQHPTFAFNMLAPISYLKNAIDIPYCHHEKWDGTGYPRGLKGEQIPLAARVFAVVDVWDAVTSDRPYRSAWNKKEAMEYIKEQSGMHFDPQVVDAFLKFIA